MASNPGSLVLEMTTLPTMPKPLPGKILYKDYVDSS